MKKATQLTVNDKKQRAKLKMNFQATSDSQAKKLTDSASVRAELCDEVSDIVQRSPLTEFMDAKWKKKEIYGICINITRAYRKSQRLL